MEMMIRPCFYGLIQSVYQSSECEKEVSSDYVLLVQKTFKKRLFESEDPWNQMIIDDLFLTKCCIKCRGIDYDAKLKVQGYNIWFKGSGAFEKAHYCHLCVQP